MDKPADTGEKRTRRIWIISRGDFVNLDLSSICKEPVSGPVTEYRISELAHYLLNPDTISLEEKVVGCKVRYRKPQSGILTRLFRKRRRAGASGALVEEIISSSRIGTPDFRDEGLNAHFIKISEMLRPYDPVQKKLAKLDRHKVEDITAICEEISGNRYTLNLQGSLNEKINFLVNSMSRKTKVVFNRAYLMNGLFEMRGFKFDTFNPDNYYRLIKFNRENRTAYCVLDADYGFEFWVDDGALVHYMHIFEQSVRTDPRLEDALALCIRGEAMPLKLFFSKQLEQKYSVKRLPETYRKIFSAFNIGEDEKNAITNMLNSFQSIVFFNFVPDTGTGRRRVFTNITVMHDFRALEPIRSQLPELYSEIDKKTSVSDAGKLYLLDSIREYQNV
ncbi:MAG: hypothetical protein GXP46_06275 [Deferribacteres bacterium]|nr:hypothetical protein [Deferribacteres bacterium]